MNSKGVRLDMTGAVQHDLLAAEDYSLLRDVGIACARDGLRWHLIDRGGELDWSSWIPMLNAARAQGVQVIWDLFHYGWPDGLDVFSPAFVDRFARFAREATRIHLEHSDEAPFFSPMNEISFFAWGAARDLMYPYAHGRDRELKVQLVRANIAAVQAIRDVAPQARLISPEPLIHTVPPRIRPTYSEPARIQNESQYEAWDMLSGRAAPELGGRPEYLDIVGLNFYAANQWEMPNGTKLHWDAGSNDPRWVPLHMLIDQVYRRYERPLFLAETSHYGKGRAAWLDEVAAECVKACESGIPLEGVCLYPILDRFDWEDPEHWHHSGLWDMKRGRNGHYSRVLNAAYSTALKAAQAILP